MTSRAGMLGMRGSRYDGGEGEGGRKWKSAKTKGFSFHSVSN